MSKKIKKLTTLRRLQNRLTDLYEPDNRDTLWFTYGLIFFDALMIVYLVISSFFYGNSVIERLDFIIGIFILLDFLARMAIAKSPLKHLLNPLSIIDMAVIGSLVLPVAGESLAFLRVIRIYAILRAPYLMDRLKKDFPFFVAYEDVIKSVSNFFIFVFVMTAVVFEAQIGVNDKITNYLDALYFTISTLTTTGFGDVTLVGNSGHFLSVIIMIFGVSLFIRLIQTMFAARKVRYSCEKCGLYLHERDASHCKSCGGVINIPDEGMS